MGFPYNNALFEWVSYHGPCYQKRWLNHQLERCDSIFSLHPTHTYSIFRPPDNLIVEDTVICKKNILKGGEAPYFWMIFNKGGHGHQKISGWWFPLLFILIPGETIQFDLRIFFKWVVQPPTRTGFKKPFQYILESERSRIFFQGCFNWMTPNHGMKRKQLFRCFAHFLPIKKSWFSLALGYDRMMFSPKKINISP